MGKVLIACEESQTVCKAFRERGHEAYSCDIQEPSGGHPEWHIHGDAIAALEGGEIVTMDGVTHDIGKWDLLIAHPPCTYLSNVATRAFSLRCTPPEKVVERWEERAKAAVFFMYFALADIPRIAVVTTSVFMLFGNTERASCGVQPSLSRLKYTFSAKPIALSQAQ